MTSSCLATKAIINNIEDVNAHECRSPSVLEPVKIALAPAQAAAPYGGQAIVHALKELATAQDKAGKYPSV